MTPPATAAAARRASARVSPRASTRPARAPVRRASRRPARARSAAAPLPARLVPLAVGGTAAAVSGLADTGLFVRLTRGRLWIGLLAVLLAGIVAINVFALSFGATASRLGQEADGLQRANSALRAGLAGTLSEQRVQAAAIRGGLIVPEPGSIRYLRWHPGDARIAARRLAAGEIVAAAPALPVTAVPAGTAPTASTTTAPTTAAPATTSTTATQTAATTATTAGTATTTSTTATTPTTAAAPASGGVAAP
jgi:hypothetical protein